MWVLPGQQPSFRRFQGPVPFWLLHSRASRWRSQRTYACRKDGLGRFRVKMLWLTQWSGDTQRWGRRGAGYLPGELDVVKDDEGALDIEDCAVIYAWRDVVVAYGGAGVHNVVCHFTRIVCCFSCKLLKSASSESQGGGSRVSDSVLQSSDANLIDKDLSDLL